MSYTDDCLAEHLVLMRERNTVLGNRIASLTDVWKATEDIIGELEKGLDNWQEEEASQ